MRKKITRRLSFDEVNRMSVREILDAFKITIAADTDEETMEAGCRKLRTSDEFRSKFAIPVSRQWTLLEKKLNLITLIHAAKVYDLSYPDWDSLAKALASHAYDETNAINIGYQTIATTYDMDAMTYKYLKTVILDYTNTSLQRAPEHLSIITGLDKEELKGFCDARLVNEIIEIRHVFETIPRKAAREWYKRLVDEINDHIYPVPGLTTREFLTPVGYPIKRIAVADYVILLTVIKHINSIDHNLAVRYLTPQGDNMADAQAKYRLFDLFAATYETTDNEYQISVCPQEHLLALANYFKPEYVHDPDITHEAQSGNEGIKQDCPDSAHEREYFDDMYERLVKMAETVFPINPDDSKDTNNEDDQNSIGYDPNNAMITLRIKVPNGEQNPEISTKAIRMALKLLDEVRDLKDPYRPKDQTDPERDTTDNPEHPDIPSLLWENYMDILDDYARQMNSEFLKRNRNGKQFTWDDLGTVTYDIFHKLWNLMTKPTIDAFS